MMTRKEWIAWAEAYLNPPVEVRVNTRTVSLYELDAAGNLDLRVDYSELVERELEKVIALLKLKEEETVSSEELNQLIESLKKLKEWDLSALGFQIPDSPEVLLEKIRDAFPTLPQISETKNHEREKLKMPGRGGSLASSPHVSDIPLQEKIKELQTKTTEYFQEAQDKLFDALLPLTKLSTEQQDIFGRLVDKVLAEQKAEEKMVSEILSRQRERQEEERQEGERQKGKRTEIKEVGLNDNYYKAILCRVITNGDNLFYKESAADISKLTSLLDSKEIKPLADKMKVASQLKEKAEKGDFHDYQTVLKKNKKTLESSSFLQDASLILSVILFPIAMGRALYSHQKYGTYKFWRTEGGRLVDTANEVIPKVDEEKSNKFPRK